MDIRVLFSADSRQIDQAADKLDDLGTSGKRAGKDIDLGMDRGKKSATGLSKALRGVKSILGSLGLVAALTAGVSANFAFADSLAEVSTLVDTTSFSIDKLTDSSIENVRIFGGLPTDKVQSYYSIISAGSSTAAEATDLLTASNKLAVGGVTEVGIAADGLTSSLNAYGDGIKSADDASDAMFIAMKAGKTTIGELSANIGNVAPLAAQAGVSFDELLASTAALTKGGVSTSVAMTGLKGIVSAIVKPSSEAAKEAKKLGIDFSAAGLESKGFAGFLKDLQEKTGGSTEKMAKLFGGVEALTPVLALTGKASKDFANTLDAMAKKTGATEEAFNKMVNSPGFQANRVLGAITAAFIELGRDGIPFVVPLLKGLADAIWKVTDFLKFAKNEWVFFVDDLKYGEGVYKSVREAFTAISKILGILGDKFSFILEPLGEYSGTFATIVAVMAGSAVTWGLVATGIGLVTTAVGVLLGVLASPVVLIAGIATAAYAVYENWDRVLEIGREVADWWNNTTLDEIVADINTAGVELAEDLSEAFFDWWDDSSLKVWVSEVETEAIALAQPYAKAFISWWDKSELKAWTTEVKTEAISLAEDYSTQFIDWWNQSTLNQLVTAIKTDAIDFAGPYAKKFFDWWDNTTLEEKVTDINTEIIQPSLELSKKFFDWWDNTTLEEKITDIKTHAIELARNISETFFHWWDNSNLKPVVTEIVTDAINDAKSYAELFFNWWDNTTLEEKLTDINTAGVELGRTISKKYIDWWNHSELKLLYAKIEAKAIKAAQGLAVKFDNWWNSWTLKDAVAEVTYHTLVIAWDTAKAFYKWWQNLKLKDLIPKIKLPSLPSLKAKGSSIWKNISDGFNEGVNKFKGHIAGANKLGNETVGALQKNLKIKSPSQRVADEVGVFVDAGLALGIKKGSGPSINAAGKLTDTVTGKLKSGFDSVTDITDKFSTAIGKDLSLAVDGSKESILKIIKAESDLEKQSKDLTETQKKNTKSILDSVTANIAAQVELKGGKKAVAALELKLQDMTQAEIDFKLKTDESTETIKKQIEQTDKVEKAFKTATDALRIKTIEQKLGKKAALEAALELKEKYTPAQAAAEVAIKLKTEAITKSIKQEELVKTAMEKTAKATEILNLKIGGNEDAAKALVYVYEKGFNPTQAAAKVALDKTREAAEALWKKVSAGRDEIVKLTEKQDLLNVRVNEGATAADLYAEKQKYGSEKIAEQIIQLKEQNELLENQGKFYDGAKNALNDFIMSAENDFTKLRDTIVDLFNNTVLKPKIEGVTEQIEALLKGTGSVGGVVGAVGDVFRPAQGTSASSIGGLLGSYGTGAAVAQLFGGGEESQIGAGIGAGIGNVILPGIGGAVGSALGGLIGSLFGGKKADASAQFLQQSGQFDVYSSQNYAAGLNFDRVSDFGHFGLQGGAGNTDVLGRSDNTVPQRMSDILDAMQATDNIISGFLSQGEVDRVHNALENFTIKTLDPAEIFKGRLGVIKDNIDADIASLININAPLEALGAQIELIAGVADKVVPALQKFNFNLGRTEGLYLKNAVNLTKNSGGIDALTAKYTNYLSKVVSAEQILETQRQEATKKLTEYNQKIGASGKAAITSKEGLESYVERLNENGHLQTQHGQYLFNASLEVVNAIDLLSQAQKPINDFKSVVAEFMPAAEVARVDDALTALNNTTGVVDATIRDQLVIAFDALSTSMIDTSLPTDALINRITQLKQAGEVALPAFIDLGLNLGSTHTQALSASLGLVDLAGGFDQFISTFQSYVGVVYSEEEQLQVKQAQAAGKLQQLNTQLGLTGDAAIDSVPELRAYVDSLNESGEIQTELGRVNLLAALESAEAVKTVADSGKSLDEILTTLPKSILDVAATLDPVTTAADAVAAASDTSTKSLAKLETSIVTVERSAVTNTAANDDLATSADKTSDIINLVTTDFGRLTQAGKVLSDALGNTANKANQLAKAGDFASSGLSTAQNALNQLSSTASSVFSNIVSIESRAGEALNRAISNANESQRQRSIADQNLQSAQNSRNTQESLLNETKLLRTQTQAENQAIRRELAKLNSSNNKIKNNSNREKYKQAGGAAL